MPNPTRRDFLRTTAIGTTCSVAAVGSVNAQAVTVEGKLLDYQGDPIENRRVQNYGEGEFNTYTDSNGKFSAETKANARLNLTFYKTSEGGSTDLPAVKNGIPYVYNLGEYYTDRGDTDLGELELPRAYRVRLRVLNSDGEPVANAIPGVRHNGSGIGSYAIETRADGWAYFNQAETDGIALTESVLLSMEIPTESGGAFKLEERVRIDAEKIVVFQIGEGVTVSSANSTPTATPTDSPTATETPTDTPTDTPVDTSSATPTANSQPTATQRSTTEPTATPAETTTQTAKPKRGFITNGEDAEDLGPLENPLVLTVGGFALSVIGIAHQMIRGY